MLARRRIVLKALSVQNRTDARYFLGAPTRQQAKDIFWNELKSLIPRELMLCDPREGELELRLFNGAIIRVLGMDVPERAEGVGWDGGVLDEYANMKPSVWREHVRPMLTDRLGWCWFIGVPEGRNHFFELYQEAQKSDDWDYFSWKTADILPLYLGEDEAKKEIEQARRDMDELTFRQEYEADFVDFAGRAYYAFNRETHCRQLTFYPEQEIVICLDFNVSPGTAVFLAEYDGYTGIIGEVWIEKNSNTPRVCHEIRNWLSKNNHIGSVYITGDPTGGLRGTAKVFGSDWDIVEDELRPYLGDRLTVEHNRSAPRERARVNAVNTRLKSADNKVRLFIDPDKAPKTVEDFEGVVVKDSGELEKNKTPMLTHLTDAIGYYIVKKYPPGGGGGGFINV